MLPTGTGNATPERRKGQTLSVSDPFINRVLAGITIEGCDLAQIERWGKSLNADAKRWAARGGFGERGRITKRDAEHLWRRELAGAVSQ